jgi:hypothetical protein
VRPFRVVHEAKASHYDYNITALRERLGEGFFAALRMTHSSVALNAVNGL